LFAREVAIQQSHADARFFRDIPEGCRLIARAAINRNAVAYRRSLAAAPWGV
jgi:hypothetical protein